jgi:two-component sensor histidine kinase
LILSVAASGRSEEDRPEWGSSIKAHLIAFGLVCFLPAFIAGALVSIRLADRERASVVNDAMRLVESFSHAVDAEIAGLARALQALATSRALAHGDLASFRNQAARVADNDDVVVALRDRDGRMITEAVGPAGGRTAELTLNPVLRSADERALATRRLVVTDLFADPGGRPVVGVVLPVLRDGEVTALLTMAVKPERIARELRLGALAEKGWLAAVVGSDARVIARTRDQDRFIGVAATGDLADALKEHGEGTLSSVTLDGVAVFTAYRRSDMGWATVVSVPSTVLNAPVRSVVMLLLAIGALVLAATVAGGWAYGRIIGRELQTLADNASRIRKHAPLKPFKLRISEVAAAQHALTEAGRNADGLMRELDHRVKNTLSVVQAMAARTVRDAREQRTLTGRINALTQAHEALSQSRWEGVFLERLVRMILDDVSVAADIAGPALILTPRATTALAQVFQELGDNARLHGALAGPEGRLAIHWTVSEQHLQVVWSERGRPGPEHFTPRFGLKVVELCVVRQLNGTVSVSPSQDGWDVTLVVPLESPLGVAAVLA